ncbi:MAG: ABC transporter substrate-binding protein [bacterium]|nr:ABC transporter substrate-binding protein [bacterium]
MTIKNIFCLLAISSLILQFSSCKKDRYAKILKDKEVKIGLNVPTSGPYMAQGSDQVTAFKIAIEELNAKGGILGKKIIPVEMDSASKPKIAVGNVKKMIKQDGVAMVTGSVSSGVAIALNAACQKMKTLYMATVSHSDETTGTKAKRYAFRKSTDATMDAKTLASILVKNYSTGYTYFFITADYSWGWSTEMAIKNIVSKAGAKITRAVRTPLGTQDFTQQLDEIAKAKPDILVLPLFGNDLVTCIKQLTEKGLKKNLKLIVVPYIEINMAISAGPDAIAGIVATKPWYWGLQEKFPKAKSFVEKFYAMTKKMPGSSAESAYVTLIQYAKAVERVKSFDPKLVIPALEGHKFTGLKDEEEWRSWDHQCIQTVYLVKGKARHEMKNEFDFFTIIDELKGSQVARTKEENPVLLDPLE